MKQKKKKKNTAKDKRKGKNTASRMNSAQDCSINITTKGDGFGIKLKYILRKM